MKSVASREIPTLFNVENSYFEAHANQSFTQISKSLSAFTRGRPSSGTFYVQSRTGRWVLKDLITKIQPNRFNR
jgi:hypothetical protein